MAKDEQSFMDWLVEDICNTIEIKGAVEATRDENGKVDKWAAAGLAMGLGHTSDDEMATLAGFLGAEGAFDDDKDDISCKFDDIPVSVSTSRYTAGTAGNMSEAEYERKKQDIISNTKTTVGGTATAAVLSFIGLIAAAGNGSVGWAIICVCLLILFVWTACYFSKQRDNELRWLEREYTESKNKQKQEETKRERDAAQRGIDERLLHDPAEETAACDDSANLNVNIDSVVNKVETLASDYGGSTEYLTTEDDDISEIDDEEEEFEDTFIGTNLIYADDMKLLSEAGYDEFDLDLMEPEELKEAMEDAGVDTYLYDFD